MSLYQLTPQDFSLQGNTLKSQVQGYSFVMFMTQNCQFCHEFLPQLKNIPGYLPGVTIAVCSVDGAGSQIHKMSLNSTTQIKAAPTFIFYNNGLPFAEYKGSRTAQDVINFINGMIDKCQRSMQQTQSQQQQTQLRTRADNNTIQRQMPQIEPRSTGQLQPPGIQQPIMQQPQQQGPKYTICQATGVKEFETSYGRPYNTTNDQEFLDYEKAYLEAKH